MRSTDLHLGGDLGPRRGGGGAGQTLAPGSVEPGGSGLVGSLPAGLRTSVLRRNGRSLIYWISLLLASEEDEHKHMT